MEEIINITKENLEKNIYLKCPKYNKNELKEVILFGAAIMGGRFISISKNKNINIVAVVDNDPNKWGSFVEGIRISEPKSLSKLDKRIPIIITCGFPAEVAEQVRKIGFRNIYYYGFIICRNKEMFGPEILPVFKNLWYSILENKEKIIKLYSYLNDEKSKEILKNIIRFRLQLDYNCLKNLGSNNEYFTPDIIRLTEDEVFVDGGAFTGDTVMGFCRATNNKFSKIYAFEPDVKNFSILKEKCKEINDNGIIPLPYGLSRKKSLLPFIQSGLDGSKIDNTGKSKIECTTIDHYFSNQRISFIKLDIEGAEKDVLLGARGIITTQKPKLAICVYHTPTDLWEIPLLIKTLVPEYKIYLRHYFYSDFLDTVCYAVVH